MIRNKAYGKDKRTNKIAEETEETTWIEENLAIFNLLSKFTHMYLFKSMRQNFILLNACKEYVYIFVLT